MFTEAATAAAEARLQAMAAKHGVWAFVVTNAEPDPPRMLDAPMGDADRAGARAVAVLFGPDRIAGGGYSLEWTRSTSDQFVMSPPDVDGLISTDPDAALERIVDYLEGWLANPTRNVAPGPALEGPSIAP